MNVAHIKSVAKPCIRCGGEPYFYLALGVIDRHCFGCMMEPRAESPVADTRPILVRSGDGYGLLAHHLLDEETLSSMQLGDTVCIEDIRGETAEWRLGEQDKTPPFERWFGRLMDMMPLWRDMGLALQDAERQQHGELEE